jgi:hypothetical protein
VLLDGSFDDAAARLDGPRRYVSLVPTQLRRLLDSPALTAFDAVLLGGAAAPADLLEAARARGVTVVTTYGMSETSGGCVYDGVPLDGVEVEAADRIRLRGTVLAKGYRDGERFDGWFTTGDVGEWRDGRLVVLGRADDVVVTGGEKVAPAAVEARLREHPSVVDAAVVGVPDDEWGQRVVAVVVLRGPLALAEARDHVAGPLPRAAAPASFASSTRCRCWPRARSTAWRCSDDDGGPVGGRRAPPHAAGRRRARAAGDRDRRRAVGRAGAAGAGRRARAAGRRQLRQRPQRRRARHRRRPGRAAAAGRLRDGDGGRGEAGRAAGVRRRRRRGLVLALLTTLWLVVLGAVCIAAAWGYTGTSRPYGYRGLGEVSVFVFFGLVATCGTAFVQGERVPLAAVVAGAGTGALACAILVANNLRDLPGDERVGKRTLAVVLGDRRTRLGYASLVLLGTVGAAVAPVAGGRLGRPAGRAGRAGPGPAAGARRAARGERTRAGPRARRDRTGAAALGGRPHRRPGRRPPHLSPPRRRRPSCDPLAGLQAGQESAVDARRA